MAGSFPILNKIKAKLFASGGLKKEIPVNKQEDGTLSYEEGFGTVYDKPIYDGGKYISRDEFNGILADLHEQIKELQTQLTKADLKVPNATEAEHANNLRNMTDLRGTTQTLWPTNWGSNAELIPTFAGNWENPGHIHVDNLRAKLGVDTKEPAFSVLPISKGGTGKNNFLYHDDINTDIIRYFANGYFSKLNFHSDTSDYAVIRFMAKTPNQNSECVFSEMKIHTTQNRYVNFYVPVYIKSYNLLINNNLSFLTPNQLPELTVTTSNSSVGAMNRNDARIVRKPYNIGMTIPAGGCYYMIFATWDTEQKILDHGSHYLDSRSGVLAGFWAESWYRMGTIYRIL